MRRILSLAVLLVLIMSTVTAQSVDELKELVNSSSGQQKSQYLLQLSNAILDDQPAEAFDYAKEALTLAGGNTSLTGAGNALAAQSALELKKYDDAISFGKEAAKIYESSDKKNYAVSQDVIGDAYEAKGDLSNCITHNKLAYEAYLSLGKDKNAAYNSSAVGNAYNKKKEYKSAIEWYQKSANSFKAAGKSSNEVQCLQTIGAIYSNYGDYDKAKTALDKALSAAEGYGLTSSANDIKKSLEIVEKNQSSKENVTAYEEEKNKEQEEYIQTIKLTQAKTLAEIENLSEELQLSALKEKAAQDEANILSLKNEQLELAKNQAETEKALAQSEKEKAEAKSVAAEAESQRLWIVIGSLFLVAVIILLGFLRTKKLNDKLKSKNEEISKQKDEIEKQSNSIQQSIDYATRIQTALLPSASNFKSLVPNSFVFLKPKDNVSGDFFWYGKTPNGYIAVAADCTGHGVPGAFMSIIFSSILDKVVTDDRVYGPNEILETTCAILTTKLMEHGVAAYEFKDGMDVSVVNVDLTNKKLMFSGARNSIYLVREGELTELKATKRSVAVIKEAPKTNFKLEEEALKSKDFIFMFSDGFADQKGGEKGKKFYYAPFKELLIEVSNKKSEDIPNALNARYVKWKGDYDQFDDVMIVGMQID